MTEPKAPPLWLKFKGDETKVRVQNLVEAYRKDWGNPQKPLLADAHALLDDSFLSKILKRNPKHRDNESAFIWLLRQEVRRRLLAGDLMAEGLRDVMGQMVQIPVERWPLFQIDFDRSEASRGGLTIVGIRLWRPSAQNCEPRKSDTATQRVNKGAPELTRAIKQLRVTFPDGRPADLSRKKLAEKAGLICSTSTLTRAFREIGWTK